MNFSWRTQNKVMVLFRECRLNQRKCHISTCSVRRRNINEIYNSERRPTPVLDQQTKFQLSQQNTKKLSVIEPSEKFNKHVVKVFENSLSSEYSHILSYLAAATEFNNFLRGRKVPLESSALAARHKIIEDKMSDEFGDNIDQSSAEWNQRKSRLESSIIYKWASIEFNQKACIIYLLSRTAAEYASLTSIFNEIKRKDTSFQPRTLYDFGSGVGTGLWALGDCFGDITEAFCVDPSSAMNDLARLILTKGVENDTLPAGISFRLHNPKSNNLKYDLVLSSNTMLELPNAVDRLNAIHSLWTRVEPGGCLVLVEMGTNAGFTIISEARDYINQLSQLVSTGEECGDVGHVLAPCPHDLPCPRYLHDSIPCNFPVRYRNFNLKLGSDKVDQLPVRTDLYTYLVVKKGEREVTSWPRLVEQPIRTKGNIYCRLCTAEGTLQEVLCSKKADSTLYQHAKSLKYGQEVPVHLDWTLRPKVGRPWLKKKEKEEECVNNVN